MLNENLLYPYGFVFTDKQYKNIPKYYKRRNILDNYIYFYDERTPSIVYESNDVFVVIHGNFKHVGIHESMSADDLAKSLCDSYKKNYNHFLDTLDFIGGRFAIIIGDGDEIEIFNDATAMRSVYYTTDHQNFVASHFNLVKDNIQTEPLQLARKYGAIDFTYDRSPAVNVRAIMPNFKLDFNSKKITRFFPRENNKYTNLDKEERYQIFERLWKNQVNYFISEFEDIAFSLTGGNDSRISLSMLKEHKDKIRMFTYASVTNTEDVSDKFEKSHDNDRRILEQMKSNLDLNHEFYFFKDNKFDFSDEEMSALMKNVFRSHGRFLVAYYMKSFPKEQSLHIRANLMEIGRAFLISPTDENTIEAVNASFIPYAINKTRKKKEDISDLQEYTAEQNKKFYSENLYDYHRLDLAFWETRMGRWHAEIVNETDIAFQSLIPYNMRALIDISLSFPYEIRKSIKFFRDLINRNYPVLNFFGYNNFNNLYEQSTTQGANIHSPYSKYRNNIFNAFSLYNCNRETIKKFINNENTLYIDRQFLTEGNYAEITIPYKTKNGHLNLSLRSPYSSKTGKNILIYELYHNEKLLLQEDMADWKFKNNITIFNLKENDYIKLKVKILQNRSGAVWEKASRLFLSEYTEYSSAKIIDKNITATSPESILSE